MKNTTTLEVEIIEKMNQALTSIDKLGNKVDSLSGKFDKAAGSAGKIGKTLANVANLGAAWAAVKRLGTSIVSCQQKAQDFTEQLNLFNVVFKNTEKNGVQMYSKIGLEATRFQNKLQENFGAYKTQTMRYQALFQSMGESSGINEKTAGTMSRAMTKMTYDLASLFNANEQKVAEALKAGVYAGQTKPMRNFGIDITQTSMKPIADELGLEKSISQMSQAEKQMLRYIAVLRQGKVAMGDFANTIESPANQFKILRQQVAELQTQFGSLFMGLFANVLPYINAILMVLKEIIKTVAGIFGIKLRDYNTGLAQTEDYFEDIGDSAGGATKKAKALKKEIMSFDQIHNIDTPTSTGGSGGSGGGISGSIDPKLLDAIKDYDNGLDSVRMKAVQIRDRIMEWLGFTKQVDKKTGEITWKYSGWQTTLKNVAKSFKDMSTTGKILVGLGIGVLLADIISKLKTVGTLIGTSGIGSMISNLLAPTKNLFGAFKDGFQIIGVGNGVFKESIQYWRVQEGIIDANTGKLNGLKGAATGAKDVLIGLGEAAIGLKLLNSSFEDIARNGINLGNSIEALGGTFTTVLGGVQAGAVFGPWGAVIGGVVSGIGGIISAADGVDKALNTNLESIKKLGKHTETMYSDWKRSQEDIDLTLTSSEAAANYHKSLFDELESIVDENGKIKKGYEDRAETITTILSDALGIEIDIVDGQIQKYDELKRTIDSVIEKKKAQTRLSVLEQQYTEAVNKRGEAEKEVKKWSEERATAEDNLQKKIEKLAKHTDLAAQELIPYAKGQESLSDLCERLNLDYDVMSKQFRFLRMQTKNQTKAVEEAEAGYKKASKTLQGYNTTIYNYEKATEYMVNENYAALNFYLDHEKNVIGKSLEQQNKYWNSVKTDNESNLKELEKNRETYGEELYNELKDQYEEQIALAEWQMNDLKLVMKTKTGEINDDVVDQWRVMGEDSLDEAMINFRKLPTDIQTELVDKMKQKGLKVADEFEKGIAEKGDPSINVQVKEPTQSSLSTLVSNIKNKLGSLKLSIVNGVLSWGTSKKANGGIFSNGRWSDIAKYASGGLPSQGQMFIAREAGPELVGKIGSRTAVMNNNQIVSSVADGVARAVAGVMGKNGAGAIQVVVHTDEGVVVDRINRITETTGTCPINI